MNRIVNNIWLTSLVDLHVSQGCKKCRYTLAKKIFKAKLTYCDHSNKNVEHLDLRIVKI